MTKKSLKISVVIPVYNGDLLIERCLDSVFHQTGGFNLEVIVVNDGSSDGTLEILNSYPKPLHILTQKNQGPATARNKGIASASGTYLAFLDADDYWETDFIKETITFLEKNDIIAVSVGQTHKIIGKSDKVMPELILNNHSSTQNGIVLDNFYLFWSKHNHVCTGSVVMQTEIVKQTGGQRPELRVTEDLEFWAFLATFGKWGFIPKLLFTSDGGLVTKKKGWIAKNKSRWASAPTLEQWESRIVTRIPKNVLNGFNLVQGKIAKNLSYAMVMSKRIELARKTTLKYKASYPKDTIAFLMFTCCHFKLTWHILAKVIFIRETFRRV